MVDNSEFLKKLSSNNTGAQSKYSFSLPGATLMKKYFGKSTKKQAFDLVIFSAGIILMYQFGKKVADNLDSLIPSEKSMMDMMKNMGPGGPGGMGPPM